MRVAFQYNLKRRRFFRPLQVTKSDYSDWSRVSDDRESLDSSSLHLLGLDASEPFQPSLLVIS